MANKYTYFIYPQRIIKVVRRNMRTGEWADRMLATSTHPGETFWFRYLSRRDNRFDNLKKISRKRAMALLLKTRLVYG